MDASRDGECHKDADEHDGLQRGTTINIQVALLGGQTLSFETHFSATVSDIKALIHEQLDCQPGAQALVLDTTILTDSSALLKDVGVNDGSLLSLALSNEPLGQNLLTLPFGSMMELSCRGTPNEVLNEFQLLSLQAAWKSGEHLYGEPAHVDSQPWGNLGGWDIDLHWTTRSNNCRYEYWSTAPGDNECGALIRIDTDSVICIGGGSDDGLCVFRNFHNDRVAMQLVREGWPRFQREEEAEETNEDCEHSTAQKEAIKAIQAMKKLTPHAKKKAIKKLRFNVQIQVASSMQASASAAAGNSVSDATTGSGLFGAAPVTTGGGLFGAPLATTGDGLFGAAPAKTAGGLFSGGSLFVFGAAPVETGSGFFGAAAATTSGCLFGTASVTTGGGLFGDAVTGRSPFGAPGATGGDTFSAPLAATGDGLGLFRAAPATTAGGIFATDSDLFGAATTTSAGLFGATSTKTGAPVGTSSKQAECQTQSRWALKFHWVSKPIYRTAPCSSDR